MRASFARRRFAPPPLHRTASRFAALRSLSTTRPTFEQYDLAPDHPLSEEAIQETQSQASKPFAELKGKIHPDTLRSLTGKPFNFTNMSSVQERVLGLLPELIGPDGPHGKEGGKRDLLVKARTGTGKTIAFLTPALESRISNVARKGPNYPIQSVGTLVISPTRELASQIAVESRALTSNHRGMERGSHLWVGGESKGLQIRNFQRDRKDFVVATPGRLKDMLQNVRGISDAFANLETVRSRSIFLSVLPCPPTAPLRACDTPVTSSRRSTLCSLLALARPATDLADTF